MKEVLARITQLKTLLRNFKTPEVKVDQFQVHLTTSMEVVALEVVVRVAAPHLIKIAQWF
jgi:hypothetical protein